MRLRTLIVLTTLVALSFVGRLQPSVTRERVYDVEYDGQLYLALTNGTLVAYRNGTLAWKLSPDDYGVPVLLTAAPPHGLLVLTDAAWLGLITRDGRVVGWMKLDVDPNAIVRGRVKLVYAGGTALAYAGGTAVAVKIPDLKLMRQYAVKNTYLGGSVSPQGDRIAIAGFDTFCFVCVQNEEKLLLVARPEEGEELLRATVNQLRDASVLWRQNWLVLAQWDSMKVYDLERGALNAPLKTYTYSCPVSDWLSWGFSPGGGLFHYICSAEGSLRVFILDVETGSIASRSLPFTSARRILSALDDDYRLVVVGYSTPAEPAYVFFSDVADGAHVQAVDDLGTPRVVKVAEGSVLAVFSGGFVVLPSRATGFERQSGATLALLSVKVIDEAGTPLSGALVCANASCATTSVGGTATLQLEEGVYLLKVTHPTARGVQALITAVGNVTKVVTLERLYVLVVRVSSDETAPGNCTIRVYGRGGGAIASAAGCTATFRLPRGSYLVEAELPRRTLEQTVEVEGDTSLHFFASGGSELSVSVYDESDAPLLDATVIVLDSRNATVASGRGGLSISLTPGRYTVMVQKPGYFNWSATLELTGSLDLRLKLAKVQQAGAGRIETDGARDALIAIAASLATLVAMVALRFSKLAAARVRVSFKPRTRSK